MKYNNKTQIPHPGDRTTAIFIDLLKHHLIHNSQKMGRVTIGWSANFIEYLNL